MAWGKMRLIVVKLVALFSVSASLISLENASA
jgi:hypothetical protein